MGMCIYIAYALTEALDFSSPNREATSVLDFSRPGKPTDNSYIESLNGKFRAECLNAHWFMSLDDARIKMEDWQRDYNEFRPHNKVPISLMNGSSTSPLL